VSSWVLLGGGAVADAAGDDEVQLPGYVWGRSGGAITAGGLGPNGPEPMALRIHATVHARDRRKWEPSAVPD